MTLAVERDVKQQINLNQEIKVLTKLLCVPATDMGFSEMRGFDCCQYLDIS